MKGEENCGEQAVVEARKKSEDCDICHVGLVCGAFLSFSLYAHAVLLKTAGIFSQGKAIFEMRWKHGT